MGKGVPRGNEKGAGWGKGRGGWKGRDEEGEGRGKVIPKKIIMNHCWPVEKWVVILTFYCTWPWIQNVANVKGWPGFWFFLVSLKRRPDPGLAACVMSECEGVTRVLAVFCQNAKGRHGFWLFLSEGGGGWPGFLLPAASPSSCDKYKCQYWKGMGGWG